MLITVRETKLLESDLPLSARTLSGQRRYFTSVITGSLMQGDSLPMVLDRATVYPARYPSHFLGMNMITARGDSVGESAS